MFPFVLASDENILQVADVSVSEGSNRNVKSISLFDSSNNSCAMSSSKNPQVVSVSLVIKIYYP